MKDYKTHTNILNLHLFDGASGAAGAAGAAAGDGGAVGAAGADGAAGASANPAVTTAEGEDRQAAFDKFIADNRDLYDQRVQKQFRQRFRDHDALQAKSDRLDALEPILSLLGERYGVDTSDTAALQTALDDDRAWLEEAAAEAGMSTESFAKMRQLERDNKALTKAARDRQEQEQQQRILGAMYDQAESVRAIFPDFDLDAELRNEETGQRFYTIARALGKSPDAVMTAYKVIHEDEIQMNGMAMAANAARNQTVNAIRARGNRPQENGVGGANGAVIKDDPSKWDAKKMADIHRRVMRGERIEL